MRIKGTEYTSRQVEVDISPRDCAEHLSRYILQSLGLNSDMRVKDGKIVEDVEYHTSHSWSSDELRFANPTPEQLSALAFVQELNKQVNAASDRCNVKTN